MESQERKIRGMAELKDADMVEVICDEGESGRDLDRPGMGRLLGMVKRREVQMVIFAKVDRITRSIRDLTELVDLFNRKRVILVSVAETLDTSSAAGRMFVNILGLFAQFERERGAERTSEGLQAKKRRGEPAGNVVYGYRADGAPPRPERKMGDVLVVDPGEQAVIAKVKELKAEGKSLRTIANELNGAGMRTRRGTPWRFQYVANVLEATL